MRWAACVLLIANTAGASPDRFSIDGTAEIGLLSASRATVTAGYTRRFWGERAYAEGRLGGGTTGELLVVEEQVGIGLVFRRNAAVELRLGWRVGHSYLRGAIDTEPFSVNLLAVEVVVQVAVAITPRMRVRAIPLGPTLYWNRTYGGSLGLEAGVDYAF